MKNAAVVDFYLAEIGNIRTNLFKADAVEESVFVVAVRAQICVGSDDDLDVLLV